jgi:hypothetical protein
MPWMFRKSIQSGARKSDIELRRGDSDPLEKPENLRAA